MNSPSCSAHYIGMTVDLDKRLASHRRGRGSKCTSHSTDWEYIETRYVGPYEEATDLERYMHVLNLTRFSQINPTHMANWLITHPLKRRQP